MDKYENYDLRDEQWKRIEPLLPPEYAGKKGRPRKGNRMMLNGMMWMNHSGAQWRQLPERYGPWQSVYARFAKWQKDGVWENKIIYTTNMIEGLNRQFRQITKNKPSFTSDDSLRRMLYLASQRIVKHWHARCQNWDLVLSQLQLMFADRAAG